MIFFFSNEERQKDKMIEKGRWEEEEVKEEIFLGRGVST